MSNNQPCWTCTKACGGCSWSKSFKPIDGWVAKKTLLEKNGEAYNSFKIIECPEYEEEQIEKRKTYRELSEDLKVTQRTIARWRKLGKI